MKYPIGIQDFRKLREDGYVYIDKTRHIFGILGHGNYFFLSRPRRFGKSLLLSTMNEIYCGSKELFKGLWIENNWDWAANKRPVIWLKFASQGIQSTGIIAGINHMLDGEAERFGVVLTETDAGLKFKELLQKVAGSSKVVVLIDEYDKPIIDNLDDVPTAEYNRNVLKNFYSVLKDSDPFIELLFITGVSAFSKVSIFSDLNNLKNITLHPNAFTLLGITQAEMEDAFAQPLLQHDKDTVREWYNGYSWGGEKVYNPFSLLNFFDSGQFQNYWHLTGTPTFLIKEMKKHGMYNVTNFQTDALTLNSFDFTRLNPITVLFQTGYLTIRHYELEDQMYILDYPNREVRQSMEQLLMAEYMCDPVYGALPRVVNLRNALRKKDMETAMTILNATFASIPAELWKKDNEHFYHALIHLTFSLLGTYVHSEVNSAHGRADAIVETADYIYAFEFKLNHPVAEAMRQIQDRGYLAPYADSPKEKIAVGVSFSTKKKAIVDWEAAIV